MGVAGSGKSSVGKLLSIELDAVFLDGDDMHPPENITKMSSEQPLDDDDRRPWLQNIGKALKDKPDKIIIACSALKKIYRDLIRETAGQDVIFIHLIGSLELIKDRMAKRTGHFMPLSLLESQFEILETPDKPENFMPIDIDQPLESIVEQLTQIIKNRC
ncbi:MAG: gluconokinase [SAR202 cluster bacterium]|nr:gluconokinase [SAR202 cluster bacterium]